MNRKFGILLIMSVFAAFTAITDAHAHSGVANSSSDWYGTDKHAHLKAGVVVGALGTLATESPAWGTAIGCGAGALNEVKDYYSKGHTADFKDFAVTCIGSALGAYSSDWVLTKTVGNGYGIFYKKGF